MNAAPLVCCTIALLMVASGASAQTQTRSTSVYRCGPEGRDLRDSPCPQAPTASAARVEFDQPSAAQARDAQARADADARRAQQMQKQRLEQEAEARRHADMATGVNGLAGAANVPASGPSVTHAPKTSKPRPVVPPKPVKPTPSSG